MLCSYLTLVLTATTLAVAVPMERRTFAAPGRTNFNPQAGSCNIAAAVSNMQAANPPLPPPAAGLTLSHVAIGRGTQNYTCDTSNATAIPVATGALASLFNVSCMAADSPALLEMMPSIALEMPNPAITDDNTTPGYADLSGHHFFIDATTAFFNMQTEMYNYGSGAFKKVNASSAPTNALAGQNGQGYGAVPWLKLNAKSDDGQTFQEVYRLNTQGGTAPPTCAGQPAAFEVQYAAEYWLFT